MFLLIIRKRASACILAAVLPVAACLARGQESASASAQPAPTPGAQANAAAYVESGAAAGKRGDLDDAVKAFESAIKLDPKYVPAYYNLGNAKMLQGKTAEAIKNFDKAIALDPNYRDAYDQRGNLRGRHGDFTGAIADFQQAVRISPDLAPGHYNLGHAYYFIGDLENSSKELEIALGLDPNFATAYFIRGLVRHAQGHNAEATNDFRKSLGFNFPDAAFWIFICESEDGLADTAHKDLTDALNTPEAFKRDDFPTAIGNFLLGSLSQDQLLARAQAANGENRDDFTCASWFYAGASQRLAGNKAGARDCFKKAIDTNSKASEEYIEAQREIATLPGL